MTTTGSVTFLARVTLRQNALAPQNAAPYLYPMHAASLVTQS